ncbi:MAG: DUF1573 domain-containing protein [candidate division Zixibacteria bacterium]|nr:DUF1573 domain-containing protein [candidate division Zixibacteria bacterium]
MTKRPKIQTNEGPPDKRVTITVNVTPRPDSTYPIRMQPYKLDLSQLSDKVIDEIAFTIKNVSEEVVDLTMISYSAAMFDVDLPETIDPGKTVKAELKLTDDGRNSSFEKSFTLELNDQRKTRFTVPVKRTLRNTVGQQSKIRKLDRGK